MAMMTKMRDNAHVFIIAFIVVFVAFWVVSDVDLGSVMQGSTNEIGNVGGKSITYTDFNAVVDRMAEQKRQENNGKELTENDFMQLREQVWNDFVTQSIVENAIEDFGITVSDQEITDWVFDYNNPPEQLSQYFMDSLGRFNAQAYEQFLLNPGPENEEALVAIEGQLKSELLRSKLTNILTSSVVVSEEAVRAKFVESNIDFTVSYVFFDPNVIAPGDTAAPTEQEYDAFYKENKERFKVEDMRKLKYVIFPDVPSAGDTSSIAHELGTIRELAESGTDFLELVNTNSEQQYDSTQWFTRDMVAQVVADSVFSMPVGSIVGPYPNEIGLSLYKVMASREGENTLYNAAHILFRTDGGLDDAAQKAKAQEVLAKAKSGVDFTQLAAEYSEEPGAGDRGGALPWFGKDRMVKEFEDAVMNGRPGQIVGPVKTQFGYHVIKVNGSSRRELQLAEVRMSIRAGSRTRDELFERARNFGYFALENGFEQEAEQNVFEVLETPDFAKQTGSYVPGIGTNPSLMKFAFEFGVGEISEVHRSASGYVVCMVSDKRDAGYRPIDEVKEQITAQVVYERQLKKTLEYAKKVAGNGKNLQQITANDTKLSVATTPPFKLQQGVPNIGPDEAFVGRILGTDVGKTTAPFRGLRGVYVARIDGKSEFDETEYKVKRDELRQEQLSKLQNEFIQAWIEQKRGEIDIVDNRDRFSADFYDCPGINALRYPLKRNNGTSIPGTKARMNMKHPRWNTADTVLLRGFFFLLCTLPLGAQGFQNSISVSAGYLEKSQVFLNPQSPDAVQRQMADDLGSAITYSASYRYKLHSPIALQLRGEYVQSDKETPDQVGTIIRNGYDVWLLELDATFSLPFSTDRFDMFVGGGGGVYLGRRIYAVAGAVSETTKSVPAFGIHLVIGAEYLFTETLGVHADVLFRDPQISVENRFTQPSVSSRGVEYPLQETNFLSHINLNGNVYAIGISWHF